jgi:hypothetical protein
MTSDIKLNDGRDGTWVTVEGNVMNVKTADIILDSPSRRGANGGPFRRALVHDQGDGLTINFANDYPGGVTINGLKASLRTIGQVSMPDTAKLPKDGAMGDLLVINHVAEQGSIAQQLRPTLSLWLCLGAGLSVLPGTVSWARVPLGDHVTGTE